MGFGLANIKQQKSLPMLTTFMICSLASRVHIILRIVEHALLTLKSNKALFTSPMLSFFHHLTERDLFLGFCLTSPMLIGASQTTLYSSNASKVLDIEQLQSHSDISCSIAFHVQGDITIFEASESDEPYTSKFGSQNRPDESRVNKTR